jgi:AcrR family transcriptional regulator
MGVIERKEREKEQRRNDILKAGESLFMQQGLKNTTMEQISNACEISRGTLYLYFKSKEELFGAIVLNGLVVLAAMMKESIDAGNTVEEKLAGVGRAYLSFYKNYRNYFKFLSYMDENQEVKKENGEMFLQVMKKSQDIWNLIVDVINKGIDEGIFKKDVNPYEISLLLWAGSNGVINLFDHLMMAHCSPMPEAIMKSEYAVHIKEFSKVNLETSLLKLWDSIFQIIRVN